MSESIVIQVADLGAVRTMAARIQSERMLFAECPDKALITRWGYTPTELDRLRPAAEAIANRQPWSLASEANPVRQAILPRA